MGERFQHFEAEAKDMTGDSTVAEIQASGGMALRMGFTDDRASAGWSRRSSRNGAGSISWSRMPAALAVWPMDSKESRIRDRLLVNDGRPAHEEQRSGKIITVASVAGTAASRDSGYAHYGAAEEAMAH